MKTEYVNLAYNYAEARELAAALGISNDIFDEMIHEATQLTIRIVNCVGEHIDDLENNGKAASQAGVAFGVAFFCTHILPYQFRQPDFDFAAFFDLAKKIQRVPPVRLAQ